MEQNTIVYNQYWIDECVKKLKREMDEADELNQKLSALRWEVDPVYVDELNRIIRDVQDLEHRLALTHSAMENYMYDMEAVIARIAEKIENADNAGPKLLE